MSASCSRSAALVVGGALGGARRRRAEVLQVLGQAGDVGLQLRDVFPQIADFLLRRARRHGSSSSAASRPPTIQYSDIVTSRRTLNRRTGKTTTSTSRWTM